MLSNLLQRTGLITDGTWRALFVKCFCLAGALHFLAAYNSHGYLHLDEHFQIIEFANLKLGGVEPQQMTWEYRERARPWLQPAFSYATFRVAESFGVTSPIQLMRVLRALSGLFGLTAAFFLVLASYRHLSSEGARRWVLFTTTLFCVYPWLHVRSSSENYSGTMMVFAIATLLFSDLIPRAKESLACEPLSRLLIMTSGMFCSLAFAFRYQVGFMIAGLVVWLIIQSQDKKRHLAMWLIGFAVIHVFSMMIDRWGWGAWSYSPWHYLRTQVIEGVANRFGVSPWWYFSVLFWREFPQPFGAIALLAIVVGALQNRRQLIGYCTLPFIAMHFLFGHKEARFLIPVLFLIPLLSVGIVSWWQTGRRRATYPRFFQALVGILVVLNCVYLVRDVLRSLDPDLAAIEPMYKVSPAPQALYWLHQNPLSYNPLFLHFYKPRAMVVEPWSTAKVGGKLTANYVLFSKTNMPNNPATEYPAGCRLISNSWIDSLSRTVSATFLEGNNLLAETTTRQLFHCQPNQLAH